MLSIPVLFASNRNGRKKERRKKNNGHVDFCQDQNLSESPPSSGINFIDYDATVQQQLLVDCTVLLESNIFTIQSLSCVRWDLSVRCEHAGLSIKLF